MERKTLFSAITKQTNGSIEFLHMYPVVAANALLEIVMAVISSVLSW